MSRAGLLRVDDILRMRGLQPKSSPNGRGGYTQEQRQAVVNAVHRLESIWVDVGEMPDYSTGRKQKLAVRSRAVVVTDAAGLRGETFDTLYVKYRPGDVFSTILIERREVAWLSMAALAYDYAHEIVPKRLAKYLAMLFRINAKHGCFKPISVQKILEAIGEELNQHKPLRTRERLEKALDRLHDDGVIRGWEYKDFVDRLSESRKGWSKKWLDSKVVIEPPEPVKEFYREHARGGQSKMGLTPPPDPEEILRKLNYRDPMGERIKTHRRELGISQLRLGERMGVSHATIGKAESGKQKISDENRRKLEAWLKSTEDGAKE